MRKFLLGLATLPFLAGIASAGQPLGDRQMDAVVAGFIDLPEMPANGSTEPPSSNLGELPSSNVGQTTTQAMLTSPGVTLDDGRYPGEPSFPQVLAASRFGGVSVAVTTVAVSF